MDALTAQSIRRLCGRLEAMRAGGAIPALMAEYRVSAPEEERRPLSDFEDAPWGASMRLPECDTSRTVWLAAGGPRVASFQATCTDAARVAIPTLRQAGFAVGLGAIKETDAWLWSIFEMASLQLPGVPLRLEGGDIYRVGAGGVTINEPAVVRAAADPTNRPFAPLILAAGPTRYWKLTDAIEASLAVLDIAQTWSQPDAGASTPPPAAATTSERRHPARSTKKIDVDHYLGRLEARMRKKFNLDFGQSETAIMEGMIRELYSLSAEDLIPLLKPLGFKGSAKTVRRSGNSQKYAAWERYRRPGVVPNTAVDVGPAALRGSPVHSADAAGETLRGWRRDAGLSDVRPSIEDAAADAIDAGHLSKRAGGRGTTRVGKTTAEKAAEDAANRFAQEAGVELPPAE
jgi:hypothetical protein